MMNRSFIKWLALFSLLLAGWPANPAHALPQDSMRRFAVVIGANDGGASRTRLRYAVSDAQAVTRLLQKIGGVFPIDCELLIEPDREALLGALKGLQAKIRRIHGHAGKVEMIFYYSGHSDEEAVLLGGQKVYYSEIKRAIEAVDADVRIAILDSCSSGAFTRIKGGQSRPPFLVDDANDMKGSAFLTSSSSDEVSQESDRLRSSFFTHYLVSGMRGAADMTQDGRVTLNEAYQYAYHETLMKTEKTLGGPQHPNYDIQMTGTGDVVLTDIRQSSAIMLFDKDIQGRIVVRDAEDRLVLEMRKPAGKPMQIGLEEGRYTISLEKERALYETMVELSLGQEQCITPALFAEVTREAAVARGEAPESGEAPEKTMVFNAEGYRVIPWDFMLKPEPEETAKVLHHNVVGLAGVSSGKLDGFSMALGLSQVAENGRGAQLAFLGNELGWSMQGAQVAGIFNRLGKNMQGIQFAGISNFLGGDLHGTQTAGIFSICQGDLQGCQASGIYNVLGGSSGAGQLAGVFNVAQKRFQGFQAAGVFNVALEDMEGAQCAGVINVARGRFRGAQFGLINIAEDQQGIPLGLVNLSKNGGVDMISWADNLSGFNLGVQFRSGHFYSIISGSKRVLIDDLENAWGAGVYYGMRIPLGRKFYVASDMGFSFVNHRPIDAFTEDDLQMAQFRVMAGATFRQRVSVFVGTGGAYIYKTDMDWENAKSEIIEKAVKPLYFAGAALHF